MQLSEEASFFQAEEGGVVVYGDMWGYTLFFSADGRTFLELKCSGFIGSSEEHYISFEDPHNNRNGCLHRKGDKLTLDDKIYTKVEGCSEIEVVPLPTIRKPEYLYSMPDRQYIYVSDDQYSYSYESFKFFIGTRRAMRAVPIKNVSRYRDGGTTIIETEEGTLFSPTPFNAKAVATWKNNVKLTKLDPAQFDIIETDNSVQLRKRS